MQYGRTSLASISLWAPFLFSIALLPNLGLKTHINLFDNKRIIEIFLISIGSILILVPSYRRNVSVFISYIIPPTEQIIFLLLILLIFISSSQSKWPLYALQESGIILGLGLSCLLLSVAYLNSRKYVKILLATTVLITVFWYETQFIVGIAASIIEKIPVSWPLPLFGFVNVRFFGHFHLAVLPLLAWIVFYFRHPTLRMLAAGLLVIWCSLLWYELGRGAPIALGGALLLTALFCRRRVIHFVLLVLGGLTLGLLLAWIWFQLPDLIGADKLSPAPTERVISSEDPARLFLWKQAFELIAANPLLGIGPMHYAAIPNPIAAHPHNSLLQIASEWGLPALLAVLYLIFRGLYSWVRKICLKPDSRQDMLLPAVTVSLLSLGALSLVSGVIVMPLSQLLLVLLIALMAGEYAHAQGITAIPGRGRGMPGTGILLSGLAMAVLLIHAWVSLPQIRYRLQNPDYMQHPAKAVIGPRFWVKGEIPSPP